MTPCCAPVPFCVCVSLQPVETITIGEQEEEEMDDKKVRMLPLATYL